MTQRFRAQLVNDPFGDPALYVDLVFERRALLFDAGALEPLPTRKLLRVSHVFVSHAHMDHFIGFDRLLRACLHQHKRIHLYGPAPFIGQLQHRLSAYTWNLLPEWATDLVLVATELGGDGRGRTASFHSHAAFSREAEDVVDLSRGVLLEDDTFHVSAAVLDHKIPCLAFALEEKAHINVRTGALEEMGLPVGPWLVGLKHALARGAPDDFPVRIWWREGDVVSERHLPLGALRDRVASTTPGQKIAYVVDVAYHAANARAIVDLVRGADLLFIEAPFLEADARTAAARGHLTASQAGRLAREAAVKQVIPIHFSPRYVGREEQLRREAQEAFLSLRATS
ncbi:MAG TPA: MBL fold metallo-hydrolase [Candidatus Acidoferrum sp.]|jgi:ribonuclease Z|nr:MBL fold metallo-hydrolase [Candidatus Acidoferrum sp.]